MRRSVAILSVVVLLLLSACSIRPGSVQAGSESVAVPDVVGLPADEARDIIEELGLEVEWDEDSGFVVLASNWTVDGQTPEAGSTVAVGSEVTLAVSKHGDVEEASSPDAVEAGQPDQPQLTIGQEQAVRKAESYLGIMAFSRTGLIDQLEFEGFASEDAVFAVDHISADWNEQAALKAQSYIDIMAFSRQGLIDQLVFDGFTADEAEYGVVAIGY